jgi:hypothetical protein
MEVILENPISGADKAAFVHKGKGKQGFLRAERGIDDLFYHLTG